MNFAEDGSIEGFWFERIFATDGLSLAGANAARRAYQRLGSAWPLVDHLEGFFVPHVPTEFATETGRALDRARQGESAFEDDDCDDHMDALLNDERPLAWCLGRVEMLGSCVVTGRLIEANVADAVVEIVHKLVTEVSLSAAHDLVGGLEALATGEP